jgi:ribosome-associated protein
VALARVPVSAELRAAVEEMRRLKAREARRRQLQYIGRLMRAEDADAIAQAVAEAEAGSAAAKRRLHLLERWRERLLGEGDSALAAFLDAHPDADRQHLRQLIRRARFELDQGRPPAASRKLFRYLRRITGGE